MLWLAAAVTLPLAAHAQSFPDIAKQELAPWETGMVVAVRQGDQTQLLDAFGRRAAPPDSALSPNDVFPFPGLTEALVGVTAEALVAAGIVDQDAPLSRYLPGLTPRLGRATLRQLLTNTAGIDDAARVEGESWKEALDRLDDDAMVAEPGAVYSESRYSLPLAARVIEKAVGQPFDQLATAAVLQPLGMTSSTFSLRKARLEGLVRGVRRTQEASTPARIVPTADTVGGLPVLFTTTGDVLRFLSAWMSGGIRGGGPADLPGVDIPDRPGTRYGGGVLMREHRSREMVSLMRTSSGLGTSANFDLLPASRTAILLWSVGEWPFGTASYALRKVMDALGAPAAKPRSVSSAGQADTTGFVRLDPRTWAGTYRNGDQIFVLRDSLGALVMFDGVRDLGLRADGPATVVAHVPDGREALEFDLRVDRDGHRYVYYGDRAFEKESVQHPPARPKGPTDANVAPAPVFTPYTVAPRILNAGDVTRAMQRDYPIALREEGIGGTVVVEFFIDKYGVVRKYQIRKSSDHPKLDSAALKVASVYQFSPALDHGEPVAVWVEFGITFAVQD